MRSQIGHQIRDSVSDEIVLKRQEVLTRAFEEFKRPIIAQSPAVDLHLNDSVLNFLIYCYFYDIARTKHFHGFERINGSKKAAYLVKWLVRSKPISFTIAKDQTVDPDMQALLMCVNELFALRMGVAYAELPLDVLDAASIEPILYQFVFRSLEEGLVALWFESLSIRRQQESKKSPSE